MAIVRLLETDSVSNQNMVGALTVGSYTASADRWVQCSVHVKDVVGNGTYSAWLSRGFSETARVLHPKTTFTVASGETTWEVNFDPVFVANEDTLTCFVLGLAGDNTSTADATARWAEVTALQPATADRTLSVSSDGVAQANMAQVLGTGLTESLAGRLASSLTTLLDVASTSTINQLDNMADILEGLIENDGGQYRFTIPALLKILSLDPSGSSGTDKLAGVLNDTAAAVAALGAPLTQQEVADAGLLAPSGSAATGSVIARLAGTPDAVWDEILAAGQSARTLLGLLGTLSLGYEVGPVEITVANGENDGLCINTSYSNTATFGSGTSRSITICGPGYCNQGLLISFPLTGPVSDIDTAELTLGAAGSADLVCNVCVEIAADAAAPTEGEDLSARTWTTATAVSESFVGDLLVIDLKSHLDTVLATAGSVSRVNVWLKPTSGSSYYVSTNEGTIPPSLYVEGTGQALGNLDLLGQAVADASLLRDWTAVTGAVPDRSTLQALRFLRNKWAAASGTLKVYEEDDTTVAWEAALTTAPDGVITGSTPE